METDKKRRESALASMSKDLVLFAQKLQDVYGDDIPDETKWVRADVVLLSEKVLAKTEKNVPGKGIVMENVGRRGFPFSLTVFGIVAASVAIMGIVSFALYKIVTDF